MHCASPVNTGFTDPNPRELLMESLYFLVPCALVFIGLAIKVLFWAINNGQYDNLDTEAHRILFDAEKKNKESAQAPDDKNPLP